MLAYEASPWFIFQSLGLDSSFGNDHSILYDVIRGGKGGEAYDHVGCRLIGAWTISKR